MESFEQCFEKAYEVYLYVLHCYEKEPFKGFLDSFQKASKKGSNWNSFCYGDLF